MFSLNCSHHNINNNKMFLRHEGYKITKEANYMDIKVYMFSIPTFTDPRNSIHKLQEAPG